MRDHAIVESVINAGNLGGGISCFVAIPLHPYDSPHENAPGKTDNKKAYAGLKLCNSSMEGTGVTKHDTSVHSWVALSGCARLAVAGTSRRSMLPISVSTLKTTCVGLTYMLGVVLGERA